MACALSIYRKGECIVEPETVSLTEMDKLKKLFARLDEEYPEELGFQLKIERSIGEMAPVSRSDFRKACQSADWRDLINCFVDEEEFQTFCQSIYFMDLDEAYYHIDDLNSHQGLTNVRCYPSNMAVLELSRERKIFQIYGHSDFENEDLLAVERELYRVHLKLFGTLYLAE